MSTEDQTTDAINNTPPTRYREHSVVWLYNTVRSHMERDHLPPTRNEPDEIRTLAFDQVVMREHVGRLVKSFERKAA